MNKLRACLAVNSAIALAALCGLLCAPSAQAQDAQPTTPPLGKALVHLLRSDPEPKEALVAVAVNAELAGYLENGTFTSVIVNPGKVFIRTGDQVLSTFSFDAAPDRVYYVRVRAVHGETQVQTDIDLMDEAQGRDAVAQARFEPPAPPAPPQQQRAAVRDLPLPPLEVPRRPVYFRVDGGYTKSTGANFADNNFANSGFICGDATCTTPGSLDNVGGGIVLSGGVGYRFNPLGRIEAVVGYRGYKMNVSDAATPATQFKANVTSLSAMLNGYIEFADRGTTPYIGVGVGLSQNKVGSFNFDNGAGFSGSVPGGSKTDFAASFMAGLSVSITSNFVLDIGYRYINLGKIGVPADSASGYDGANGTLKAQELTLGFRF
jgi:opacity protein-like surface antigen